MSIEAIQSPLFRDKEKSQQAESIRLRKVCSDFESIFITKVLDAMQKTVGEDSLFGEGFGSDVYQSLFRAKLAEKMAEKGGFGLGDALYRDLARTLKNEKPTDPDPGIRRLQAPSYFSADDKKSVFERVEKYRDIIESAAKKFKLPMQLIYGVIAQESAGQPLVVSKAGAKGLMQLMDDTAAELGVRNVFDPIENIHAGSRYLRQQLDRFAGDVKLALAAYNAGPNSVEKYRGIPPYRETQDYVEKVMAYTRRFASILNEGNEAL